MTFASVLTAIGLNQFLFNLFTLNMLRRQKYFLVFNQNKSYKETEKLYLNAFNKESYCFGRSSDDNDVASQIAYATQLLSSTS